MFKLNFIKKDISKIISGLGVKTSYDKPATCPHCNCNCDAPIKKSCSFAEPSGSCSYVILFLQCTACEKIFVSLSRFYKDKDSEFCDIYPMPHTVFQNEQIEKLSPRFVDVYNQALQAEDFNNTILASVGYRTALEILIKDYAINQLGKPADEVTNKKLFDAISEYLGETDLINTADVVRILGNDKTHYQEKHPEHDFQILKKYMDVFISLIETKLLIANPPVARKS